MKKQKKVFKETWKQSHLQLQIKFKLAKKSKKKKKIPVNERD